MGYARHSADGLAAWNSQSFEDKVLAWDQFYRCRWERAQMLGEELPPMWGFWYFTRMWP